MEKVIFLDRDGVINRGKEGYVASWGEFEFLPGVFEAIRKLNELNFRLIIVSNQAGIAKGLYTESALADITERMLERIKRNNAKIDAVHYCPHQDADKCGCRKPKPGLLRQAITGRDVDIANSFFIGDSERDIMAGKSLGCKTILVLSGNTVLAQEVGNFKMHPDHIAQDLLEAVGIIAQKEER